MTMTNYVWDPLNDSYLMETDGAGTATAVYTQEPEHFGGLVSQRRASASSFFHYDNTASTRGITGDAQSLLDAFTFDAWGSQIYKMGIIETPFQWGGLVGYYFDAEFTSFYVRARIFRPDIARWTALDPRFGDRPTRSAFGLSLKIARDDNLYRYASNQLSLIDPSGELSIIMSLPGGMKHSLCGAISGKVLITVDSVKTDPPWVIVQLVTRVSTTQACDGCSDKPPCPNLKEKELAACQWFEFLGSRLRARTQFEDLSARPALTSPNVCPNSLGDRAVVHEIRIFADKDDSRRKEFLFADPIPVPCKGDTRTGGRESPIPPTYWNERPLVTFGFSSEVHWDCCVDPPTQRASFRGSPGSTLIDEVTEDANPT